MKTLSKRGYKIICQHDKGPSQKILEPNRNTKTKRKNKNKNILEPNSHLIRKDGMLSPRIRHKARQERKAAQIRKEERTVLTCKQLRHV